MSEKLPDNLAHLPEVVAHQFAFVERLSGLPNDQVRVLVCLLGAIFLGFFQKAWVHGKFARKTFNLVFGLLFLYLMLSWNGILHVGAMASVPYFLGLVARGKSWFTTACFLWTIAYMSCCHAWRQYYDYLGWTMDVTGPLMILTVKVNMFACNLADGATLQRAKDQADVGEEDEQAPVHYQALHKKPHIQAFRGARAILSVPSLYEYLGFIFFYGGIAIGPSFEFVDYHAFISETAFSKAGLKHTPSTLIPCLRRIFFALICYAGMTVSGGMPVIGYLNSAEFAQLPLWNRYTYMMVAVAVSRSKYYFGWYLSEAGVIASGLSFNGRVDQAARDKELADASLVRRVFRWVSDDKGFRWDKCANCHAFNVETGSCVQHLTDNWNMGCSHWLKHYIFRRVEIPPALKKLGLPFPLIVTRASAALWHGFYPAYYLFFLSAVPFNMANSLLTHTFRRYFEKQQPECENQASVEPAPRRSARLAAKVVQRVPAASARPKNRRRQRPPLSYPLAYIYDALGWLLLMTGVNYLGMCFQLLRADWAFTAFSNFYYYGHWGPFVLIALCKIVQKMQAGKDAKRA